MSEQPHYLPFFRQLPAELSDPSDTSAGVSFCYNVLWRKYLLGCVTALKNPYLWTGSEDDVLSAVRNAGILESLIVESDDCSGSVTPAPNWYVTHFSISSGTFTPLLNKIVVQSGVTLKQYSAIDLPGISGVTSGYFVGTTTGSDVVGGNFSDFLFYPFSLGGTPYWSLLITFCDDTTFFLDVSSGYTVVNAIAVGLPKDIKRIEYTTSGSLYFFCEISNNYVCAEV